MKWISGIKKIKGARCEISKIKIKGAAEGKAKKG